MVNKILNIILTSFMLLGCQDKTKIETPPRNWSRAMTIYEVNLRQFTEEGSIKAFQNHLPRLKEMGVDILWFMPIHPIGEKNRKGSLGSYYSVKDYYGINPEFGTLEDFKTLVDEIHKLDMVVILDWVANHCAWDNPLIEDHPDWFTRDKNGNFQPPEGTDWADVIDFDYKNPELREYMFNVMSWWVKEVDIDGFRCDVAGMVPLDFWEELRPKLDAIKPVFMLAEWEDPNLLNKAFDADYNWSLYYTLKDLAEGKKDINAIRDYFNHPPKKYPHSGIRMNFLDNHDKNSWDGVMTRMFGDYLKPGMVLTFTIPGMPLIYNGQESDLDKQLAFFEKDLIEWGDFSEASFYQSLIKLRHEHPALWDVNSAMTFLDDTPDNMIGFYRMNDAEKILVLLNFSAEPVSMDQIDVDKSLLLLNDDGSTIAELGPWGYGILSVNP